MKINKMDHQLNIIIQKRLKDLKGFYTHVFSSFLILPFIIFINLKTVPQFHWFWYAVIAWCIGLLIHWLNVFKFSKSKIKNNWQQRKINETLNLDAKNDAQFIQEQYFLKAKKETREIKGFYIHLFIALLSSAIIIIVNLKFVPGFYFFWFAVGGMLIAVFMHWFGLFGLDLFGLGKKWEQKKIKELINNYQN